MSHKIIFDEHIGTPPPSTVDVDRIIRRERRGSLLRRLTGGGSALAATALAITVGVALAGGPPQPAPGAVALPPPPSASPSTGDAQATHLTLDRLQQALEQALTDVIPDARWVYMPDVPGEQPLPDGHPRMWTEPSEPVGFAARSGVSRQGAKAGFYLWLRPEGCSTRDGGPRACSPQLMCEAGAASAGCTSSTTPDGHALVEKTEETANGGSRYRFHSVSVQVKLRDVYHLKLLAVNYFGGDGSAVTTVAPLLTMTELKAMALSIANRIAN